jgi:hypothetical protein
MLLDMRNHTYLIYRTSLGWELLELTNHGRLGSLLLTLPHVHAYVVMLLSQAFDNFRIHLTNIVEVICFHTIGLCYLISSTLCTPGCSILYNVIIAEEPIFAEGN